MVTSGFVLDSMQVDATYDHQEWKGMVRCNQVGQSFRVEALSQAFVGKAVAERLAVDDAVSLGALRKVLQERCGINLESRKTEIRCKATKSLETSLETLTAGISITKLDEDMLARLRDPYTGVWEPCSHTPAGADDCRARVPWC